MADDLDSLMAASAQRILGDDTAMYVPDGGARLPSPWDPPKKYLGSVEIPEGYSSPDVEFAPPLPHIPTPSGMYRAELRKITAKNPGITETIDQIENQLGPLPDSTRLYAAQDLRAGKPIGQVIAGIKNLKNSVLAGRPAPESFQPGSPGPAPAARPQGLMAAPAKSQAPAA